MARSPTASPTGANRRFVVLAAAVAALGGLLFGYDTGVISGALLFIQPQFGLSAGWEEVVTSAVLLGATLGALFSGRLTDYFGRRGILIAAAICFAVGAIGSGLAPTIGWLIASRMLVGAAIGVASYAVPLYISEVAPADVRGRLVSLNQLAITLGILVAYVVDYALSAGQDWRWMLGLAVVPAVLLGAGMAALPNSPRWLAGRGQVDVARTILRRMRGTTDVNDELDEIVASLQQERGRWSDLIAPAVRPALVVGVGMAIFQQITGINTVIYYAPTIIQSVGISSASGAILQTAGIGLVNVLMTIVAMRLVDGMGRRPLALIGMAGMAVSLALLGLAFRQLDLSEGAGWFAVACLMLYVASFAISLGPIFWLIIAEIYPLKIRGLAMSVATMANWAANLVVSLTFLTLTQALGLSATFWTFGLFTVAAWLFVYFLMPETKGRTLEEIQELWRRGERPRGVDVPADARQPTLRPDKEGRASAA